MFFNLKPKFKTTLWKRRGQKLQEFVEILREPFNDLYQYEKEFNICDYISETTQAMYYLEIIQVFLYYIHLFLVKDSCFQDTYLPYGWSKIRFFRKTITLKNSTIYKTIGLTPFNFLDYAKLDSISKNERYIYINDYKDFMGKIVLNYCALRLPLWENVSYTPFERLLTTENWTRLIREYEKEYNLIIYTEHQTIIKVEIKKPLREPLLDDIKHPPPPSYEDIVVA